VNIAAASRFVDVPEEEINLMKENDIPFLIKQLFHSRLLDMK